MNNTNEEQTPPPVKKAVATLEAIKKSAAEYQNKYSKIIAFAEKHLDKLNELDVDFSSYGHYFDIDNPKREDTVALLLYFGGNWCKEYSNGCLNYEQTIDGVHVRFYNAALPASCKVITTKEWVPERVTPGYEEEVTKIECKEGEA